MATYRVTCDMLIYDTPKGGTFEHVFSPQAEERHIRMGRIEKVEVAPPEPPVRTAPRQRSVTRPRDGSLGGHDPRVRRTE